MVGNEKGGSGKITITIHIALALMKEGRSARLPRSIWDSRQRSLTHYVENRRAWARRTGLDLELPAHFAVARAKGARLDQNEIAEFAEFDRVVTAVQHGGYRLY